MSTPKPALTESDLKYLRTFGFIKDPSESVASRVADFFFPSRKRHREIAVLLRQIRSMLYTISRSVDSIENR